MAYLNVIRARAPPGDSPQAHAHTAPLAARRVIDAADRVVAPGFIETDMTRALPEPQKDAMQAQIALGRFGSPSDIADAVAFLAGPSAGYITGETLHVNGGMYMA